MGSVHLRKKPAVALPDGGGLPTDVLFEVLLRLPAKTLCRLRLVCRSWRSLASDPVFATAHSSRHPLVTGFHHIALPKHEVRVIDLSGNVVKRMPLAHPTYTLNTQHDMVCVTGINRQSPGSVLNLAAGEAVVTTALSLRKNEQFEEGEVISPFLLGHVPSTGDHKVFYSHLRTSHGEEGGVHVEQLCSVTTLGDDGGRWRTTPSPPAWVASSPKERVVVGGVAYFLLSMKCIIKSSNVEPDTIAVFDPATEEWSPVTLRGPLSSRLAEDDEKLVYQQYRDDVQLAVLDGCVVTVHHNHRQEDSAMDLWFLLDMGMGVDKVLWNKRYSIRSATTGCYALRNSYPLLFLDDGKIVIWEQRTYVLMEYDPRTGKWADLANLETNSSYYFSMNMYQGNLLCPGLYK